MRMLKKCFQFLWGGRKQQLTTRDSNPVSKETGQSPAFIIGGGHINFKRNKIITKRVKRKNLHRGDDYYDDNGELIAS